MPVRKIVHIDEAKCNGCGECITSCAEGAIALVDGKARLVSEVYCDGLGACLGTCPQDAITVEEREAADFDEAATTEHLNRLKAQQAPSHSHAGHSGCPGSRSFSVQRDEVASPTAEQCPAPSFLGNWPIQLTLVPPQAPWLQESDLVLAADCAAFALGDFHTRFLKGNAVVIACPKLDENPMRYVDKLTQILETAGVRSLTVVHMEVPCCSGLTQIANLASREVSRSLPMRDVTVSISGQVIREIDISTPAQPARDCA